MTTQGPDQSRSLEAPPLAGEAESSRIPFEKFFEWALDLSCVANDRGYFVKLNPSWSKLLGYSEEELKSRPYFQFIHPEDRQKSLDVTKDGLAGKPLYHFKNRYIAKDGKILHLRWSAIYEKPYWYCNATDITEIENLNRTFFECCAAAQIGAWELDARSRQLFWTQEAYRIHGIPEQKSIDLDLALNFVVAENRSEVTEAIRRCMKSHDSFNIELQIVTHQAERRWLRITGKSEFEGSRLKRVFGTVQDIHESKLEHLNRQEIEVRMKALAKNFPGMLYQFQLDVHGHPSFLFTSEACRDLYGMTPQQMTSSFSNVMKVVSERDRSRLLVAIERSAQKLTPFYWEGENVLPSGEVKRVRAQSQPERMADGRIVWSGVCIDVTEVRRNETRLKEAENKIIEASRLSSMGEMASGIAHEINNPLTIISGACDNLSRRFDQLEVRDAKLRTWVDRISKTSTRIARIVKGLRNFNREGAEDELSEVCFQALLEESLSFCQHRFENSKIDVVLNVREGIRFKARAIQISQVLVNLVNNAIDAVENSEKPWIKIETRKLKDKFMVFVENAGAPISADIRSRIMEPFYTTKTKGKGTGLGLSLSKAFVEDHKGQLYVDERAEHPRFVIELPYR